MYENEMKELKKFIRPSSGIFVMGGILSAIALLILISSISYDEDDKMYMVVLGAVMLLIGAILIFSGIHSLNKVTKKLAEIDSNGGTQFLINDFKSGGKAFKDALILGQTFLIGKHTGTIITYNDILQIYQYVHKTNFVEDTRILKVVLAQNRKTVDLCPLPLRGKADNEAAQVINYILSRNPNVKVGYN